MKQQDMSDCGPTCLAYIARHYKRSLSVARLRQSASTDKHGTSILGIIESAERAGFTARGVKGPYESLFRIPLPSILHVVTQDKFHHYVVLTRMTKHYAYVMDPAIGRICKITHAELKKSWTGVLVLCAPAEGVQPVDDKSSPLAYFFKLLAPHKTVLFQALLGAVLYSLLGLTTSVYVQKIVDHVLIDGNLNLLKLLSVVMIILLVVKVYINIMRNFFTLKTGQSIDAVLILGYYNHLLKLPQRFFDTMRIGEILSRVNDAVKIRFFINNVSFDIIVNVLILIFSLILMFIYSWKLTAVVLLGIPVYTAVFFVFNAINKRYLRRIMEHSAELESGLVESITSIRTIRAFNLEGRFNVRTERTFLQLLKSTYQSGKGSFIIANTLELTAGLMTIALLWFGSVITIAHEITPGLLLSFYTLLGFIIAPISQLITANQTIQDALIATDRLFQIIDLEQDESDQAQLKFTPGHFGDIIFKNVFFRYGTGPDILCGLNLKIPVGEVTAIVGQSGSGKSSIASLLLKLYPIHEGNITIGKYNLQMIEAKSLRDTIVMVPQHTELFAGTILDNIAVRDEEPDLAQVVKVCETVNLSSFIEKMPNGLHSLVGAHGVTLSGGEKQKIAIARALFLNPQILVFDEATSSLDPHSESYIRSLVASLRDQGKTIVIIAHRLSTIMFADTIHVLEQGVIAEQGSHTELLERKDRYYKLWQQYLPVHVEPYV